jgi:hypothetical protein
MGVARLYKAASPLNAEELPEVDSVQSFDVLYMAHINHDPLKLTRTDHTSWEFSVVAFGPTAVAPSGVSATATNPNVDADNSGNAYFPQSDSYVVTTVDAATGQESRASTSDSATNDLTLKRNYNTIAWSAVAGAERYRIYKAHNGGDYGYVGSTTGLSFVDDNIAADMTVGPPEGRNPFAGDGDKPSTVTFFEARLWWGRTLNNPNALYSSRSADYENMDVSVPLRADDAITIRLVSQGVNQANQLVPLDNLLVFGSDALFQIEGSNEDYLSASPPPRQRRQSGRGSSRLEPLVVDSIAFYKTSNGEQIRAAGYRFEVDGVKSNDVTIFSPDFFEGFDIVDWCYAEEPLSMVWAARSDGALLAFVWEEEHSVWGWTICPLAGDGKVKSLCSVRESGEHRVYAIIERTIAGETRLFRERMTSARRVTPDGDTVERPAFHWECHLDCAVTRLFDEPTSVIDGLWHLEGETVAVFADGIVFDVDQGLVVTDGQVTLPEGYQCLIAHVGLPFDAIFETLPLNFQTNQGTSQGRTQQTGLAMIHLERSCAPLAGVDEDRLRPIRSMRPHAPLSEEDSLLTGVFQVTTTPVNRNESTIVVKQRIAPLTVTAVYLEAEAS